MTAIILGIFYAKDLLEFSALLIGPVSLIYVAISGIYAVKRASDRISKILTVRAKIEQALGLTIPFRNQGKSSDLYWKNEPIINLEHLASRKRYSSSTEFSLSAVKDRKNYLSGTANFYRFFIVLGIACEVIILFKVISLII